MKPRSQVQRLRGWITTSSTGQWVRTPGGSRWLPFTTAHAKKVGSPLTACGVLAVEWRTFWDLPFDEAGASACEACARHVASGTTPSLPDLPTKPDRT